MFAQVHHPQNLSPDELDRYLERGWFRMGQTIFTTNFLHFKTQSYSAVWLRLQLDGFSRDKAMDKLMKRNASFRVIIQPATITTEKEDLFNQYRDSISFEASTSLHQLLYGKADHNIYQTYEVILYDADKLIGVGFFDLGAFSAAGISSFYHPSYKKHSLGKYLIYLKINYCKEMGMSYFYPGYFVPGYSPFDYKLEIGRPALQYFELSSGQWRPIRHFARDMAPLNVMHDRLFTLQQLMLQAGYSPRMFRYEFFDANLIPDLQGMELFDFPLFLYGSDTIGSVISPLVVYDVRTGKYHLLQCFSMWSPDEVVSETQDVYSAHLLKVQQELVATENPEVMVNYLLKENNLAAQHSNFLRNYKSE